MKFLSQLSIKKQFGIILTGLITLTFLLSVLSYVSIDRLLVKNASAYAQNTSQKFDGEIRYLFQRIDSIFNSLLFDANIERLLLTPYSEKTPAYLKNLTMEFLSYSIMNQDISDIALVSDDLNWSNFFDAAALRSFYAEMDGSYGLHSFGIHTSPLTSGNAPAGQRLVFGYNVYGMHDLSHYGELLGGIVLSIDPAKSPIVLPGEKYSNTCFFLADKNRNVFPFGCDPQTCQDILSECGDYLSVAKETALPNHQEYLIYLTPLEGMDYWMVSAVDQTAINREVLHTSCVIIFIILLSFGLLAFFMYTLMHNMVSPLNQLFLYIEGIRTQPLARDRNALDLNGCMEICSLNLSFNEMLKEQKDLTRQLYATTTTLYETELEKKQAELDFLRSQINPHFLYNTLESIRGIALEKDVPQIAEMSDALGKLFRYNIKGSAVVPLSQELEITDAWLQIQKARFPGKFEIIYSIRENVRQMPIMKFLLQPLVENAVFHGLEPLTGRGTLFLSARRQDARLLITIQDDGIGIPAAELSRIQSQLRDMDIVNEQNSRHIGLMNVAHRIFLSYGREYGLQIDSRKGEGTKLLLTLPVLPEANAGAGPEFGGNSCFR